MNIESFGRVLGWTAVGTTTLALAAFLGAASLSSQPASADTVDEMAASEAVRVARDGRLHDTWLKETGAETPADTHALLVAAAETKAKVAQADRPKEPVSVPTNVWAISRGGQLYDNWWNVLERDPPEQTHPSYPAAGKKKGATTWRCKECHGWDYKGVDGVYGKGSHYTGIKGVRGVQGVDPEEIVKIIRNETHRYTEDMLSASAAQKLALFLSFGQIDMDRYIDRATKKAHGNPLRGAQFFQTICANCHGFDGKEMNFGDEEGPEYVGTVANENPWEALHKIRFGQPGFPMVALGVLDVQTQVDILSYIQTLPTE